MPAPKLGPIEPSTTTDAAGHVLAAVSADALDDRPCPRVADREPHARSTDHVKRAGRGAEEAHVARQRLVLGQPVRRSHHDGGSG